MAHHQGMPFLRLGNVLVAEGLPRRSHADPLGRATELLLQERIAGDPPLVKVAEEVSASVPNRFEGPPPLSRRLTSPDTVLPRTHLISNGSYTVLVTNAGRRRSTCRGLDVTRRREDRT